jgi:hypothetical protein
MIEMPARCFKCREVKPGGELTSYNDGRHECDDCIFIAKKGKKAASR